MSFGEGFNGEMLLGMIAAFCATLGWGIREVL